MARISLLFSLAFALSLGSLFLSVSGHAPPALKVNHLWPKTVSELQTLPFTKITHLLNQKIDFAPKTVEFKALFTSCKDYVAYLDSLYKLENPIVDVLGIAKAKDMLMKDIIAAGISVIKKPDYTNTKRRLRKSCYGLMKTFVEIQKTIINISAKHDYKANAKISFRESAKINKVVDEFWMYLNAFMDIVYDLKYKKMKIVDHRARNLEESRVNNAFARFFRTLTDKYGGYMGRKIHGRELRGRKKRHYKNSRGSNRYYKNSHAGADIKGFESAYEKFSNYFGSSYFGSLDSRRNLVEAHARVNAGVQFNAAEKMKFVGKDGFRSLNRAHYKLMV
ncbi:hypothetical protein AALP_AA6G341200 [Arabis alpina]|uniref:Pectinesterase inhibitor domain-containing protein n=1 Tax=Arabis alpina TaxID=50452 RepID=A0A087GTI2_ARAAL|nr:hypothetical protein AALP_AA6G341200 [Arabis alpina]